ncbi:MULTISPECIES: DUF4139 domain-containing protein [Undibacterium]|uniref:DUF4139 domain-containing protein n=1 Tax=Undibacterium umbellatum TaxID=2762300 RepID=A0ABR6ZCI0_9BURK|nr:MULTISPECIES: DUF4139 domain-containing protein [Undibacterium]MBC3909025.1 DUF4139 domain-containing protein [Undibacterium umbellatum]MDP1978716.1 DUF4139 domain-containing protein [Undibacterium sp.]
MHKPFTASILLLSLVGSAYAQSEEQRSTLADQKEVAVTIYNENLALIKDQRKLPLKRGTSALAFRDVSAKMRAETALLRSLSAPGSLSVVEQNFNFDLLTPQKLLEKYVGRNVSIVRTNPATGVETTESAQVLSANNGVVLKIGDRIETGMPGRIIYPDVPANLRDRPTLVMALDNNGAQQQDVELSYLTGGLSWKADYVVELNAADDKLDISGWVTLGNTSGTTYRNAKLQLVAGDVNQVTQRIEVAGSAIKMDAPKAMMAKRAMAEESLFEYHLYTLDRPTTIAENQTKQVALLSASGVPARKELLLAGSDYYYQSSYGDLGQKMKIGVFVEFDNKEASQLGMPLPKGVVRVYKKDGAGNAQFIGEDSVDHTPKNEKVRLKLGEAFDVTADKKQTDFKKLAGTGKYNYVFESAYELVLKNAKKEAVVVTVQEPMPGDWQVLNSSHPYTKSASNTAVWKISVPAEGNTKLTYRSLVRY